MTIDIEWKGHIFSVKDVPIKASGIKFDEDMVDETGIKLIKVRNPNASSEKPFIYKYEDGKTFVGKEMKAINGKPIAKFKKTAVLTESKAEVVNLSDLFEDMVTNELTYYLVNSDFKSVLKSSIAKGEGILFKPFKTAGHKAHKAVIYYNERVDRILMKLIRSDIKGIELPENKVVKEVETKGEVLDESLIVC